jgi:hypothetical protein
MNAGIIALVAAICLLFGVAVVDTIEALDE